MHGDEREAGEDESEDGGSRTDWVFSSVGDVGPDKGASSDFFMAMLLTLMKCPVTSIWAVSSCKESWEIPHSMHFRIWDL